LVRFAINKNEARPSSEARGVSFVMVAAGNANFASINETTTTTTLLLDLWDGSVSLSFTSMDLSEEALVAVM
jgi:hypothetical protein